MGLPATLALYGGNDFTVQITLEQLDETTSVWEAAEDLDLHGFFALTKGGDAIPASEFTLPVLSGTNGTYRGGNDAVTVDGLIALVTGSPKKIWLCLRSPGGSGGDYESWQEIPVKPIREIS